MWLSKIKTSDSATLEIDMSKEFLRIFQKFLMHVLFGADIDAFMRVEIMARGEKDYVAKECTLSEAIEETWE